jgi:hypothetical protein
MALIDDIRARLQSSNTAVSIRSQRPTIWLLNGYPTNIRTANRKAGDKYWFDVTPALYQRNQVDFLLYGCGSAQTLYIFPRATFEELIEGASLGGQKQVPNFTIFSNNNVFEPAGHTERRRSIAGFLNALYLLQPRRSAA